jgi:G:T/U-mismatch repair DNA glycosylase
LRLVLVGHNPSAAAWRDGHYYSNPSNRMWSLLRNVKIIPEGYTAKDDDRCPSTCGIGFTDLVSDQWCYVAELLHIILCLMMSP